MDPARPIACTLFAALFAGRTAGAGTPGAWPRPDRVAAAVRGAPGLRLLLDR